MKLPKSFGQLTVNQYQKCTEILSSDKDQLEKHIELIAFLSGKSIEWVEGHTRYEVLEWFGQLSFLNTPTYSDKYSKRIFVNGRWYMPIEDNSEFKAGALIALKHFQDRKEPIKYLHEMLACIYTPMNIWGKPKAYNAKIHNRVAEDMKSVKLDWVLGFLDFKKKVLEASKPIIEIYLNSAIVKIQELKEEMTQEMTEAKLLKAS